MTLYSYAGCVDVQIPTSAGEWNRIFERELLSLRSQACARSRIVIESQGMAGNCTRWVDRSYGTSGVTLRSGEFACPDRRGHFCRVDFAQLAVQEDIWLHVETCCERFSPSVLLEWVVIPCAFFPLAARGFAPLHAGGYANREKSGFVISAWSGVGKTNLVLWSIRNLPGARYLGDDLVLASAWGAALSGSRTVSLYGYNRGVAQANGLVDLKLLLGGAARRLAHGWLGSTRVADAVLYVGNALSNVRLEVDRPRLIDQVEEIRVGVHARCSSVREESPPSIRPCNHHPAVEAARHIAVISYEFVQFRRFLQTWQWATGTSADPWLRLTTTWQKLLDGYFDSLDVIYEVLIPVQQSQQAFAYLGRALSDIPSGRDGEGRAGSHPSA